MSTKLEAFLWIIWSPIWIGIKHSIKSLVKEKKIRYMYLSKLIFFTYYYYRQAKTLDGLDSLGIIICFLILKPS